MDTFLSNALLFIDRFSGVFYGIGLVGVLFYLLKAREAAQQRRLTPFPIEREEAGVLLRDALVILGILVAILATTFYIDRILLGQPEASRPPSTSPVALAATVTATSPAIGPAPTMPPSPTEPSAASSAPTESAPAPATESPPPEARPAEATTEATAEATAASATATPSAAEASATPAPATVTRAPTLPPLPSPTVIAATAIPTQPPPPTATPAPAPPRPVVPAANCPTPGVRISNPANGAVVSGNVAILGTAAIDRFQFYKVEWGQGANPGFFSVIGDVVRSPVNGGQLATWGASAFAPGIYTLRLTVVDDTGNYPAPCDIHLIVQ